MPKVHPIRTCQHCKEGFVFKLGPAALTKGQGKFCSPRCAASSRVGPRNSKWRGGRVNDSRGRVMVYAPGNPDARLMGGKYIYEYRLVAAEKIGRPLESDEIVHHLNGDHTDNRPENLEVMTQSEHAKLHRMGDANRTAHLTDDAIRDIRRRRAAGETLAAIGAVHGVSRHVVYGVAKLRTWKHVA